MNQSRSLLRYYQSFVPKHLPPTEIEVEQLQSFLKSSKNLFILTGAGLSTESGIPDYRSPTTGVYTRTNSNTPMTVQQFLGSDKARKRYWARNYLAWPYFSSREPNIGHKIIHEMDRRCLVTQNVDGLHRKAGSTDAIELHGCGYIVNCLDCKETFDREEFQKKIAQVNSGFNKSDRMLGDVRPDGDVYVDEKSLESFLIPECEYCSSTLLQPDIIFFGANVPRTKVDYIYGQLEESDTMLVVGSSLQVFSAYRFILRATELKLPICILTLGETRGDKLADLKINKRISDVLSKIQL